jgi:hypothetical protein
MLDGGLSIGGKSGVTARLKSHARHKNDWSHYSVFEVHDNVTSDEIRELEALLFAIFRNDHRIKLANTQLGSRKLWQIRVNASWEARRAGTPAKRAPRKRVPR